MCIYIYIYIHISSIYTVHVIIGYTYFSFCQNINIRTFYAHRVHVDNFACPKCHSSCSFHPRTAKDYSMSYCKTNFRTVFLNKLSRISKTSGKIRLFHTFPRTCQTKKKHLVCTTKNILKWTSSPCSSPFQDTHPTSYVLPAVQPCRRHKCLNRQTWWRRHGQWICWIPIR